MASEELTLEAGVDQKPAVPPKGKAAKGKTDWASELKGIFWLVLAVLGFHTFIAKPFYIPSESMLPGLLIGDQLVVTKYPYGYSYISPTFHVLPFINGRLFGRMPERGDVVIISPPGKAEDYIKRVIGLPGDTLEVRDGTVILNGKPVQRGPVHDVAIPVDKNAQCSPSEYPDAIRTGKDGRQYCHLPIMTETLPNGRRYDTVELGPSEGDFYGPIKIPEGRVFVMGDNRDRSADSRYPVSELGLGGPVPWENLGGRAEFITFSKSGEGSWNPLTWGESFRGGRAGTSLHAQRVK
ncbi:MAG: signal peptidase I [Sphingomonas sp.]|nr:signal peptidase I [Sphingomonas sp.]